MDTLEAIFTRRSIRSYSEKVIDGYIMEQLLRAAMQAPSARNTQSWQFVVINDREILNRIADIHPYAKMLTESSNAICVCGDQKAEQLLGYVIQNCSAATQNILLAAHALGIGAVWIGVYPREQRMNMVKDLLSLPDDIISVALIALGYPKDIKTQKIDRYDPAKVHKNIWSA